MSAIAHTLMPARRLVLVADDEVAIQGLIARVMHPLGLVALPVGDGAAAIAVVEAQRADLACAILDVVMPVLNGVDAAHAIQQIAPDLGIVLMSGAIPIHLADRITQLRLVGMLHKPFPLEVLRKTILHAVGNGVSIETV